MRVPRHRDAHRRRRHAGLRWRLSRASVEEYGMRLLLQCSHLDQVSSLESANELLPLLIALRHGESLDLSTGWRPQRAPLPPPTHTNTHGNLSVGVFFFFCFAARHGMNPHGRAGCCSTPPVPSSRDKRPLLTDSLSWVRMNGQIGREDDDGLQASSGWGKCADDL